MRSKESTNCSPLFPVGSVFNKLAPSLARSPRPVAREIALRYPARLNAMAIDPGRIAPRTDMKYSSGEVLFAIDTGRQVVVRRRNDKKIVISSEVKRITLVRHAALIMREALAFRGGFEIWMDPGVEIKHCGLGSSSGTIASVACAINEIFGAPISAESLIRYLAQNHGEEIEGESDLLNRVQCLGGSAAAGLCAAGMTVLAGEATPIATSKIPSSYKAIVGIPSDFIEKDSVSLMEKEIQSMGKFIATGKRYGALNAYNVLHTMLPAMHQGNMKEIGDVIYQYRYKMGSIDNCSFTYPSLKKLFRALLPLRESGAAPILSISSVGPGIFAVAKKFKECERAFRKANLRVYTFPICNDGYRIIRKIS